MKEPSVFVVFIYPFFSQDRPTETQDFFLSWGRIHKASLCSELLLVRKFLEL